MRKLLFTLLTLCFASFGAMAQVRVESPHPDLEVKITRCAYATGTVVIDMLITNFGAEERICFNQNQISAYDDEGNLYNINNSKIILGVTNMGLSTRPEVVFPQDIPLRFRVQLDKISANASKFSLLKFGMESRGAMALKYDKPTQIRNLEWVK